MRYALLSDVHGNRPALEAVLRDTLAQRGVGGTYHLGDLVGYSPWPNEVVEAITAAGIPGVAGNYDSTVATDYAHCGCRSESPRQEELAHVSYAWTREHVSARTKAYLGGLPFRIDLKPLGGHASGPTVTLVHATPTNNLVYVTEDRPDGFLTKMAAQAGLRAGDVLCFGHTHKPWHRVVEGIHFVNTGSVGRPKDGDPRAGYVLLDIGADSVRVEIVRVEYDVPAAAAGVRAAGLPEDFAEFLLTGGQPAAYRRVRPRGCGARLRASGHAHRGRQRAPRRGAREPSRHRGALVRAALPGPGGGAVRPRPVRRRSRSRAPPAVAARPGRRTGGDGAGGLARPRVRR
jgi:predicted phosphodiesterase